jgi:hypothetical protein
MCTYGHQVDLTLDEVSESVLKVMRFASKEGLYIKVLSTPSIVLGENEPGNELTIHTPYGLCLLKTGQGR